jgi:hypothetical protein
MIHQTRTEDQMTRGLTFHMPRRNQGQVVTVNYGLIVDEVIGEAVVVRNTFNSSDRSERFDVSPAREGDEGYYWDDPPENDDWRKATPDERDRYGL